MILSDSVRLLLHVILDITSLGQVDCVVIEVRLISTGLSLMLLKKSKPVGENKKVHQITRKKKQ